MGDNALVISVFSTEWIAAFIMYKCVAQMVCLCYYLAFKPPIWCDEK